jgi:glucan phosphoethanolaminetransferase (alkaline phosphatase superfamily)
MGDNATSTNNDDEFECIDGNAFARTGCILSYAGNPKDILLNYLMVLINLVYCAAALQNHRVERQKFLRFAMLAFVGIVVFQLSLCLALGCSGVSIIWCAMGGWTMSERRRVVDINIHSTMESEASESSTTSLASARLMGWGNVVIFLDCAVIVYYAIVTKPITTVAHTLALILGAVLSMMSIRMYDNDQQPGEGTSNRQPLTGEPRVSM